MIAPAAARAEPPDARAIATVEKDRDGASEVAEDGVLWG